MLNERLEQIFADHKIMFLIATAGIVNNIGEGPHTLCLRRKKHTGGARSGGGYQNWHRMSFLALL